MRAITVFWAVSVTLLNSIAVQAQLTPVDPSRIVRPDGNSYTTQRQSLSDDSIVIRPGTATVTFKVRRRNGLWASGNTIYLYIAGKSVGSIDRGQEREFVVDNVPTGKNTMHAELWAFGLKQIDGQLENSGVIIPNDMTICIDCGWEAPDNNNNNYKRSFGDLDKYRFDLIEIIDTSVDLNLKRVKTKVSEPIVLPAGSERVVEDSERITHTVSVTNGFKLSSEVKANWGPVSAGIMGEISRSTTTTIQAESERRRSVRLLGDGSTPLRVVWNDLYKTGTTTLRINGKLTKVPFMLKDDFELTTEAAR